MTDQKRVAAVGPSRGGALHTVGVARESPARRIAWPTGGLASGIEPSHPGEPDRVAGRLASLPIKKKIAPHQPGAKRWTDRSGDALVCVRYRVDVESGRRVVTVEPQVDDAPLKPLQGDKMVWVRIERHETEARALAKQSGAQWDWGAKAWATTDSVFRKLRWMDRIVEPPNVHRSTSPSKHRST